MISEKGQTIHTQKSLTDAKFNGMMSLLEKSTNGDKHGLLPFHSHILEYGNVAKLEGVRSSLFHYGRRDVRKNVGQSQHVGFSDHIMVLPAPCTPEISQKVETICHTYDLPVTVCTPDLLVSLTDALGKAGLSVSDRVLIGSDSYGGVRNIGLAYAALHGYDQIIMIDDDECISPDYKARALAHIGERYKGKMILGKDGCVEDKNGRKTYDGQKGPWGSQWPKGRTVQRPNTTVSRRSGIHHGIHARLSGETWSSTRGSLPTYRLIRS
jgi:hypothetical protein